MFKKKQKVPTMSASKTIHHFEMAYSLFRSDTNQNFQKISMNVIL